MDNILNASLLFVSFESYLTSIRNLAYILRKNKFRILMNFIRVRVTVFYR